MSDRDVKVEQVFDGGDDVLVVVGTVDDEPLTAQGWRSAVEQHVDKPPLEGEKATKPKARAMTESERDAYFASLLLAVASPPAPEQLRPAEF